MATKQSQFATIQQAPTGSTTATSSSIGMSSYDRFKDPTYLKQALGSYYTPSTPPPTFKAPKIEPVVRTAEELGMKAPEIKIPGAYSPNATAAQIASEKAAIAYNLQQAGSKSGAKAVEAAYSANMANYQKTQTESMQMYQNQLEAAQAENMKMPTLAKAPVIGTPTVTEQDFAALRSISKAAPSEEQLYQFAGAMVTSRYRYDQAVSNAVKAYNEYLKQYEEVASTL